MPSAFFVGDKPRREQHESMNKPINTAWLQLAPAAAYSGLSVAPLLAALGNADAIIGSADKSLRSLGVTKRQIEVLRSVPDSLMAHISEWLLDDTHRLITVEDVQYPEQLRLLADAPAALFAVGDIDLLSVPSLAIVGSRNPTAGGKDNATQFARYLASHGLAIVSGLAEGIDAAAHAGSLDADGATIAVLGTGIDVCYPTSNRNLCDRIKASGVLVSEYPPGRTARSWQFPARNRIISGLSLGTLVVEATRRSGSLITARLAGEQGKSIFAIPGSIHNPLARGCHQLIRQGALLVEQADDVFSELGPRLSIETPPQPQSAPSAPLETDTPQYSELLDIIGWDPVTVDTLVLRSGLTTAELSSMLLIMELKGLVQSVAGGRYQRCGSE